MDRSRFRRPRQTRSPKVRGQAMAEFVLVISIFLVLVITPLQMAPAIAARGSVLETASAMTDRAARFLAPSQDTPLAQKNLLCTQLLVVARAQLKAALPGKLVTSGVDGCRWPGAPDTTHNPVIGVIPDDPAQSLAVNPGDPPVQLTICLSYQYDVGFGLIWLSTQANFGGVSKQVQQVFTYRYCGRAIIYAHRTR